MKKDFTKLLGIVSAVLMLQGCSGDGDAPQLSDGVVPVSVEVGIRGRELTRAGADIQSTFFLGGEKFKAYFPTDVTLQSTTFTVNPMAVTQATPAVQPFVKKDATSAMMHAYYPSAGIDGTAVDQTTSSFTVAQDQSSDENYKKSDLMYAMSNIDATGRARLVFNHRMSKIVISAKAGRGLDEIREVRLLTGYRTVDIVTPLSAHPGITLSNAVGEDQPLEVLKGNTTDYTECAALLPPQTLSSSDNFLWVETDGGIVRFKLNEDLTMYGGQAYVFDFTIDVTMIGLTATITAWTVNPQQNVDTEL